MLPANLQYIYNAIQFTIQKNTRVTDTNQQQVLCLRVALCGNNDLMGKPVRMIISAIFMFNAFIHIIIAATDSN